MIKLVDVAVRVPGSSGAASRPLLCDITLDFVQDRIAIIGANGSGKSTLLRLLNGLVLPTSGRVEVDGLDTRSQGAQVRRVVAFTFTDPLSQLVLSTPLDDVELSLRSRVRDRGERRSRALAVLAAYGLADLAERSIYDLSGGERQLAALASVLALKPRVLLCDEPTTLLDLRNRDTVAGVLDRLPNQVILATHDLDLAGRTERVVLLDRGRVVADGSPGAVIDQYRRLLG